MLRVGRETSKGHSILPGRSDNVTLTADEIFAKLSDDHRMIMMKLSDSHCAFVRSL